MIILSILLYNWMFSAALGVVVFGFLDILEDWFDRRREQDGKM